MSTLTSNILSQPESLACTLQHQCGNGAESLAKAAALLRSGKRVVITGMGASLFASLPLQYFLCSLGIPAVTIEAGELLHYLHSVCKDSILLVVSRSGESIEVARLLTMVKGIAPVIGVTNRPQSQLAKSADVSLNIASLEDEIVAIQTYTGTLLTLHLLGSQVADTFAASAKEAHKLLPAFASIVQENMRKVKDWDSFLAQPTNLYLLARGASSSSAQEGALLFHEVTKYPAVAMQTASFRHGPVEVVNPEFRGFIFSPQDKTRDLNIALAKDLVRFGGSIRLIGPPSIDEDVALWCSLPATTETLTPLFEIVPLQVAALRLAELRGIRPGSFRFAPQVATDEASFGSREASH